MKIFLGTAKRGSKLHLATGHGARCHEGLTLPHEVYPMFGNPWSPLAGEREQVFNQMAKYRIDPEALCAKCFPDFLMRDFREALRLYGRAHP